MLTALLSCCLILGQENRVGPSFLWKFQESEEFFVEETHRQLLQTTIQGKPVKTYLDYSMILKYRVRSATSNEVLLERVLERHRVNNLNEAGKAAIDALKNPLGSRANIRLTKKNSDTEIQPFGDRWHCRSITPSRGNESFLSLLFTLGPARPDSGKSEWSHSLSAPVSDWGVLEWTLGCQAKQQENSQRFQVSIRPQMKWIPAAPAGQLKLSVQSIPHATTGLGVFDSQRGRWDYLDYRLTSQLHVAKESKEVELKQDFTAIYRVFANRPSW